MKATVEDIRKIVEEADILDDAGEIQNDIKLTQQGVDSLDLVNIYLLVEEKFGIKIPDEDLSKVETVDDIVAYVNSKIQ